MPRSGDISIGFDDEQINRFFPWVPGPFVRKVESSERWDNLGAATLTDVRSLRLSPSWDTFN
jgi:hypothetical protein